MTENDKRCLEKLLRLMKGIVSTLETWLQEGAEKEQEEQHAEARG